MTYMSPPLRYPGGKSRALKEIMSLVPDNFKEYREPFCGGGSIFLAMKQRFPDRKFWINDLYKDLYTFWNVLRTDSDKMINLLLEWKRTYEDGKMLQQYLRINKYKFNDLELACSFIVNNRTSFSGIEGGFSALSYQQNFTEDIIRHLKDVSNLLTNIHITNLDYQKIIESPPTNGYKYEDIYTILDPPYFTATNLYGKKGSIHKYFDHYRFAKIMKNINDTTKMRWLITYDDCTTIRKLFDWANIVPWELVYTSRNPKIGKEIFIANYNIKTNNNNKNQLTIENAWGI